LNLDSIARAYVEDINFLEGSGLFNRSFEVDEQPVWEGLCMRAGRLVASNSSAERIGALTLLAISACRLPEGQTVQRNALVNLQTALTRVSKAYEPLMDALAEDEAGLLEDVGDETDELEEDEDDGADAFAIDRAAMAREKVDAILRWVKSRCPARPSSASP
jgi:hypothetical protein